MTTTELLPWSLMKSELVRALDPNYYNYGLYSTLSFDTVLNVFASADPCTEYQTWLEEFHTALIRTIWSQSHSRAILGNAPPQGDFIRVPVRPGSRVAMVLPSGFIDSYITGNSTRFIELFGRTLDAVVAVNATSPQGIIDTINDAFLSFIQILMIPEERDLYKCADAMVSSAEGNPVHEHGPLTADVLMRSMNSIIQHNLKCRYVVMGANLVEELIDTPELHRLVQPVDSLERLKYGYVGNMFGALILTDAFRRPEHRSVEPNSMYAFGEAPEVGFRYYDDQSKPRITFKLKDNRVSGVHWHISTPSCLVLRNPQTVYKSVRRA